MARKIKVLVVDDSALIRQLLTAALGSDPEIEVVGAAPDPLVARSMIKELNPDVLTLDVEMPNMDGISFLDKIMRLRPMPVVMVSTLTQKGAGITMQALEMGAVDFVPKPTLDIKHALEEIKTELVAKVKLAATARVVARSRPPEGAEVKRLVTGPGFTSTDQIVAIGSSTGGVEALKEVITILPADSPPILITQHMPPRFTASFAARLDTLSAVSVTEAKDGVRIFPGHVYIAPGDFHLLLHRSGGHYYTKLSHDPPVSGHRPSVDVLFNSVAEHAGHNAIGVILTGMGKDGAAGLKKMLEAGAQTIGQDEASSLVYGMPKAAKLMGAVQAEIPIGQVAQEILARCKQR
ncbi:chemotaxis response regulator protein-glutamate methylesterase [Ferrovibrio sp.]|uniref:protein-glutamate methylesterase/protein-glutamine glutaminase n=1 Tax=Ferrovibrio sp. TaxID=1917215 RepID=UPI0025BAA97C|nr:chemotaxis response regulator protein-glutamate methylesterase [Ferrovibrio sp.]MBX3454594.1 chemotaxis response regulator protein-glutamate methylesterase [Ferrovibrio sp.]